MNAADQRTHECPWRESAALHVLGNVKPEETSMFIAHLDACAACRAEYDEAALAVAELDLALAQEAPAEPGPSSHVRARLLDAIAADVVVDSSLEHDNDRERGSVDVAATAPSSNNTANNQLDRSWRHWNASEPVGASREGFGPGLYAVGASDGLWERVGGIDGIEVKRLATDIERRLVTMLIRMAPGSAYPRHRHAAKEECYVISGDLKIGVRPMSAGDYQLAEANSIHEVQSTERGCLLLITSSQDDEMLD